ncbi:hypothetical protein BKA03_001119 [Demequina lutea]|uniref:Uncharacterized protein n=1 Tax=Demequina lutea TaxID=431489 RepID=A0A7Y9ZA31_9MICO|nr:hypothetical protein [Demequina lutea]
MAIALVATVTGTAVALAVLAGCAGTVSQVGTTLGGPSASPSARVADSASTNIPTATANSALEAASQSARQICEGSFGTAVTLDWAPATVDEFRAYQYGGPVAKVPLADAFPGVPGDTRGAWCGTKESSDVSHWWAVVAGHEPVTFMTVQGPSEGIAHGLVVGPPQIP